MDTIPKEILTYILWLAYGGSLECVCKLWQRIINGMYVQKCEAINRLQRAYNPLICPVELIASKRSLGYHQCVKKYNGPTRPHAAYVILVDHNAFKIYINHHNKFIMIYLNARFPCDASDCPTLFDGRIRFYIETDNIRSMSSCDDNIGSFHVSDGIICRNKNVCHAGDAFGYKNTIQVGLYHLWKN